MHEDMDCKGDFSTHYWRIRLDADLLNHPTHLLEVLNHEITHAIYYVYSLGLMLGEGDAEEKIVSLMSVGYMKMLQDNPKILELYSNLL